MLGSIGEASSIARASMTWVFIPSDQLCVPLFFLVVICIDCRVFLSHRLFAQLMARVETLLSAQREAEHLHVETADSKAKQRELTELCSKVERLRNYARRARMPRSKLTAYGGEETQLQVALREVSLWDKEAESSLSEASVHLSGGGRC
jgi:hypothetical protein